MIEVVKTLPEIEARCEADTGDDKFYTLETGSGRPFMLVRANATCGDEHEEDQWHWVAIGKVKNRKTGFHSFEDAIDKALEKDGNTVKEHSSQKEAFLYLAEIAGRSEG